MARRLREADVGHCDLQHGNVLLLRGGEGPALRLIDYDGMRTPGLAGRQSGEVGHPNCQHTQRVRDGIYRSGLASSHKSSSNGYL